MGDGPQPFARVDNFLQPLSSVGNRFFHAAIEDGMKDVFFALEVEIDSAIGDAGLAGNIGDLGTEITVVGEDADTCAQNCFALVGNYGAV